MDRVTLATTRRYRDAIRAVAQSSRRNDGTNPFPGPRALQNRGLFRPTFTPSLRAIGYQRETHLRDSGFLVYTSGIRGTQLWLCHDAFWLRPCSSPQ